MRSRNVFVMFAFIAIILMTGCARQSATVTTAPATQPKTTVSKVSDAQWTAALREAQEMLDMARAIRNPWQVIPTLRMFLKLHDLKPEHIGSSDKELTELENTPYDAGPQPLLPREEIGKLPLV